MLVFSISEHHNSLYFAENGLKFRMDLGGT